MRPSGRVPTVPRSACRRRGRSSARVESSLLFEPTDLRDETATSPRRNRETHLQVPQAEPATVRGADLACRFGGEEFVLVMPDTPAEVAATVAERLRGMIEARPFQLRSGETPLMLTASMGIATVGPGIDTPEQLLKQADRALYEAKNSGRNRVVAAAA